MAGTDDTQGSAAADRLSALPRPTTSVGVRGRLIDLLRRDLVGPHPDLDGDLSREVLAGVSPSKWYLTGYLGPRRGAKAPPAAPAREEEEAELALAAQRGSEGMEQGAPGPSAAADDGASERPPPRSFEPSSLGLTVLLPAGVTEIAARVTWGDYVTEPPLDPALVLPEDNLKAASAGGAPAAPGPRDLHWHRIPQEVSVPIRLDVRRDGAPDTIILPGSAAPMAPGGGLQLVVSARPTRSAAIDGAHRDLVAVSVFLVNARAEPLRRFGDVAFCFQARLELVCPQGFAARDDRASYNASEFDERLADLHYRDVCSYAVGHNTSGDWAAPESEGGENCGLVTRVFTNPLPVQEVEKLGAEIDIEGVTRGMEALATAAEDPGTLSAALSALPQEYAAWAAAQAMTVPGLDGKRRRDVADECLKQIRVAQTRIAGGLAHLLSDPLSREAFAIANRVMARSNRQRGKTQNGKPPAEQRTPEWRLFQLAFVLLNLEGLADPTHPDRPVVDLLFFPTGGGKTEAYLGLAAFAIARRRLAHPGLAGAGLSVVMRYTLRLLTLDQLQRAAGLVCALELERRAGGRLGEWPIEIGLWVGGGATPNTFGSAKNAKKGTAVQWLRDYKTGRGPAPAPLKACPWCGQDLRRDSFHLHPNGQTPQRLDLRCDEVDCAFSGDQRLPIVVVDEEIYRRLPAFMIATIDKFANVPWEGRAGAFFGHVERSDDSGFYGAAETGGAPIGVPLRPIDLIIQDELHLISGPLGTVAGLYETAFDLLASRTINGERCSPKIVASTATVRRAEAQIRSLFGRERTAIFPPPGPSRHDSFFARTDRESPSRLYAGIASPGRGPKLVFLRTLQTLLAGAQALSAGTDPDPADPYLTALCYFNALRELGGARRIVDDDVRTHLKDYGAQRVRHAPPGHPFADRTLREVQELTSRYSTDQVSEARTRLGRPARAKDAVDVAMATNMISVGLDIGRLGLMVVQGQPKTAAEYIQATSRVGREAAKPGLVLTLLNVHKPRDRTHYEQFRAFHMSFYRAVEATSVTPFAARALDRALAATLVAAARHVEPDLTPKHAVARIARNDHAVGAVRAAFEDKMRIARVEEAALRRCLDRLDELAAAWAEISDAQTANGDPFAYANEEPVRRLLQDPLGQTAAMTANRAWFTAGRSMRDTEPVSLLKLRGPDGAPLTR
ncbi:DISARM system helicase DrmA [Methylorubrum populi]|uniref:Superfamily II DNA and RNA helicase n=1 Tax=Methylorubrum populi TaxID=223967 RepID=A0A833MYL5_9HYPH|nr:DISARM system helicase DrmA [Methylorubrum populi]KAB7786367.1 Superfamily II DNA and RNA helicase [Methylorubrum populi]